MGHITSGEKGVIVYPVYRYYTKMPGSSVPMFQKGSRKEAESNHSSEAYHDYREQYGDTPIGWIGEYKVHYGFDKETIVKGKYLKKT